MIRITDGHYYARLSMRVWDTQGSNHAPDISAEYFDAQHLPHDEERNIFYVPCVLDTIRRADEWVQTACDAPQKPKSEINIVTYTLFTPQTCITYHISSAKRQDSAINQLANLVTFKRFMAEAKQPQQSRPLSDGVGMPPP